ncbi:chitin deacetylase [Entophlyctis sp. JEL0112]|nr:chitin deacetylase [Entophlyctis sp. JEL0112]
MHAPALALAAALTAMPQALAQAPYDTATWKQDLSPPLVNNCTASPEFPACDVAPAPQCDAYTCYRVPQPPGVPRWTDFVASQTDPNYPWQTLYPANATDVHGDRGATPGVASADGIPWGDPRNRATEVYDCPAGRWALSYDDGPQLTSQTLALLAQTPGARATFFLIGANIINVAGHEQLVRDIDAAGHQIALHTYTHRQISEQSSPVVISELILNVLAIYKAIGKVPRYFRPPYSAIDDRVRNILVAMGLRPVVWNFESQDAGIGSLASGGSDAEIAGQVLTVRNVFEHIKADYGRKYDSRWDYFPGKGTNPTTYDGFVSLEHDITANDLAVAALVIPWVASLSGVQMAYIAECDRVMPNASWYLPDEHPLVQFIKTIDLPLSIDDTKVDSNPFTASTFATASPATESKTTTTSGAFVHATFSMTVHIALAVWHLM